MRASEEEFFRLGTLVAEKLNKSRGPVEVVVPLRGFSLLDRADGPEIISYQGSPKGAWHAPVADQAFVEALEAGRKVGRIHSVDAHINDSFFAKFLVEQAIALFPKNKVRSVSYTHLTLPTSDLV